MTSNRNRAALYARVSTTRQAEHDLSIPDQINQLRAYCERKGWEVVETYVEPGASALDENRPIFQEMIATATGQDRPYDYIVVHSFSRFSRDVMHSTVYGHKLEKSGVSLASITQELSDDPTGKLVRTILNAVDQMNSAENAKHTHRAMLENARQGFWNGSPPPFGYKTVVKERRGNKEKKVLAIHEDEAETVRMIFGLYLGQLKRPMGLKAIVSHLNERGILRRGRKWGVSSVEDLLKNHTYCGTHMFNRRNSKTGEKRSDSECVMVEVPVIVPEEDFDRVQAAMYQRAPRNTPPRVVNGPTMLAGVARCAHCGAAMIINTGKGGQYRYYSCSRAMKQGKTACTGQRIPMDKLDGLVLEHLGSKVFNPDRLEQMLTHYINQHEAGIASRKERLRKLRDIRGETAAARTRLINLVETGAMEADDPELKERLAQLKLRLNDTDEQINALQASLLAGTPTITRERIQLLSEQMRERFRSGPADLRQAYMRLLLECVEVGPNTVTVSGSNAALERLATNGSSSSTSEVLSFAQNWCPRPDSNQHVLANNRF